MLSTNDAQQGNIMHSNVPSMNSMQFPSNTSAMGSDEDKSEKSKFWLAIIALIVSTIALIVAIIIAAAVIPNLGTSTNNNMTTTTADAKKGGIPNNNKPILNLSTTDMPLGTMIFDDSSDDDSDDGPTIIVNETNKYYTNNRTDYYDVNCSCPTNIYGIINVNKTFIPGGYYGWKYDDDYPEIYPFRDIHASIGDEIFFVSPQGSTNEDVWLVPEDVYESCQFTADSGAQQIAISRYIRTDAAKYGQGFRFLIQEWHLRDYGDILYFASADSWQTTTERGCKMGIKVRVFIEEREVIPVITDDATGLDLSASQTVQGLIASIGHLSRMLILQQFSSEQRIRSEGDSGLTHVRQKYDGNHAYNSETYVARGAAALHDHSNNVHTVGMGEIAAVLNGVEFQTRHNDYNLNMPSTTSTEYGETEEILQPDVPPDVLNAGGVNKQIAEMQEWFRAFKTQNKSHRNYTDYFTPILCYLEGTWITDDSSLDEPFESDRHHLDAKTWKELHDKIRWMANSGRKNVDENLAHLPSAVRNLYNNTFPVISNWEYKILCHPLKDDIPTSRFRVVNDLSVQLMNTPMTRDELYYSRKARFDLNKNIDDIDDPDPEWTEGREYWNYLDYLMEQVPGKDNYPANLTDEFPDGTYQVVHFEDGSYVNSGYYTRYYALQGADAMGSSTHRRGWADRYLFAAKTSHEKVSPVAFDFEVENDDGTISSYPTISRWSYAIPLEIIYLTPLVNWNPYKIVYHEKGDFVYTSGKCGEIPSKAFDGSTHDNYYITPSTFFNSEASDEDAADTVASGVCAIHGNNGGEYGVSASGHWIIFPEIGNGVGRVRQRYPIFSIHDAGHGAYKELRALQDILLSDNYDDPNDGISFWTDSLELTYGFELSLEGGSHEHMITVKGKHIVNDWYDAENDKYYNGSNYILELEADLANGHEHTVKLFRWRENDDSAWNYEILQCRYGTKSDDEVDYPYQDDSCQDNHNLLTRYIAQF